MLVSGAWSPIATSEVKTALESASADAVWNQAWGRRQKLRSGCRRALKRSAYGPDVPVSDLCRQIQLTRHFLLHSAHTE